MDPYLEDDQHWPQFHHNFILCLYQVLLPGLGDRYRSRVVQRQYCAESVAADAVGGEHVEEVIEIRGRADLTLVTLLDVVSPANKTTAAGRHAYLEQRRVARQEQASVVEIDLVLQGQPMLDYSRDGLPPWDYAITVTRSTQPQRYEIYTSILKKRLPRFRLPLAADDRDTVIDLQSAFTRCYDQGDLGARIDYRREPAVALSIDDRFWLDEVLRTNKLRDPLPPDQDIAVAAYFLWQAEGCPHGQDKEHWLRAGQQMRMRRKPQ
jgi:hypothetical protein